MVDQINQKLSLFYNSAQVQPPDKGWIHAIRTTLNMSMVQLGAKLGVTRQAIYRIEDSETNGSSTINKLKEVASAMNLKVEYALISQNGTIDDLVKSKAKNLARKIVLRANRNMKLENQEIGDEKINHAIADLAYEIRLEMNKTLWD